MIDNVCEDIDQCLAGDDDCDSAANEKCSNVIGGLPGSGQQKSFIFAKKNLQELKIFKEFLYALEIIIFLLSTHVTRL